MPRSRAEWPSAAGAREGSMRTVPLTLGDRRACSRSRMRVVRISGPASGSPREMRRAYDSLRTEFVQLGRCRSRFSAIAAIADSSDVVLVGSYVNISSTTATAGAPRAFVDFVAKLASAKRRELVLVSFGTPYLLQQTPSVSSYMIAWGPSQVIAAGSGARVAGLECDHGYVADQSSAICAIRWR